MSTLNDWRDLALVPGVVHRAQEDGVRPFSESDVTR